MPRKRSVKNMIISSKPSLFSNQWTLTKEANLAMLCARSNSPRVTISSGKARLATCSTCSAREPPRLSSVALTVPRLKSCSTVPANISEKELCSLMMFAQLASWPQAMSIASVLTEPLSDACLDLLMTFSSATWNSTRSSHELFQKVKK